MILIFGGTTEGRIAAEVCEQAGRTYYYSTKGSMQTINLCHGTRLTGVMTAEDMHKFCADHHIRCIINAAHPFASALHATIATTSLPVIRWQRKESKPYLSPLVQYCTDYEDAMVRMQKDSIHHLLALSGANTIERLRPYWTHHRTTFRILHRKESLEKALLHGLPEERIIYYNDTSLLPTIEQEQQVMIDSLCDAIITKDSGDNGGLDSKVRAAIGLGIRVYIIQRPTLPEHWHYVDGKHTLRLAIQQLVPEFYDLHTGLTTGACATAAAKAALMSLLYGDCPDRVSFALPDGETITIPVKAEGIGKASVIKGNNDDPDVTKGCCITVSVCPNETGEVRFVQGKGVGTVTLPGLGIPVGEPAVNPTPRMMITKEIRDISQDGYDVCISVAGGETLAAHTFNHKVGVKGGISIIGTSGIVSPLSHEAFIQSIQRELEVAHAIGCNSIGLASGKKGEEAILAQHPVMRIVHYGNFIGETLGMAHQLGFKSVVLGIMIGKAVKLAQGHLDTHSHKVSIDRDFLAGIAHDIGMDKTTINRIQAITLARQLWEFMPTTFFDTITQLCYTHCRKVYPQGQLQILLLCDNN